MAGHGRPRMTDAEKIAAAEEREQKKKSEAAEPDTQTMRRKMAQIAQTIVLSDIDALTPQLILDAAGLKPSVGALLCASVICTAIATGDYRALQVWIDETEGKQPETVKLDASGSFALSALTDEQLMDMIGNTDGK